jgi:orotidine-5'-phosphate decarboxylase
MDQLLIALDVSSADQAIRLSDRLRDLAGGFKIGSRLFTAEGPRLVNELVERGHRVFLDLKYHDIPSTVATAVRAAADLGVWMLTVHASGGLAMLQAAQQAATASSSGPRVVAVTVLTSLDDDALRQIGVSQPIPDQVESLAGLALEAGIDGVVASPLEVERIRARFGPTFTIVTPGIRTSSAGSSDDQARTLSPAHAVRAGASYLVVGRPIYADPDPRSAALEIAQQIADA